MNGNSDVELTVSEACGNNIFKSIVQQALHNVYGPEENTSVSEAGAFRALMNHINKPKLLVFYGVSTVA